MTHKSSNVQKRDLRLPLPFGQNANTNHTIILVVRPPASAN